MSFSNPIAAPNFQIQNPFLEKEKAQKEKGSSEKEVQMHALTIQIQKLKVHTFYNRDKRVFVKAFKKAFPLLTIKTICQLIRIKVSTYYYKAKRPYFQGYVHERKADPIQFSALKTTLKTYTLQCLDNTCKTELVKALRQQYPLLTLRKICQMSRLNVSTFYSLR